MREVGSPVIIVHRAAGPREEIAQNREKVRSVLESLLDEQSGRRSKVRIIWTKNSGTVGKDE